MRRWLLSVIATIPLSACALTSVPYPQPDVPPKAYLQALAVAEKAGFTGCSASTDINAAAVAECTEGSVFVFYTIHDLRQWVFNRENGKRAVYIKSDAWTIQCATAKLCAEARTRLHEGTVFKGP